MKIYVSPHSDDVALSCGGQITAESRAKDDVLVVTVFTSEAEDSAHSALFDQINPERTREDHAAWDSIGVRCAFASLPEALLRGEFPFRIFRDALGDGVVRSICDVVERLIDAHPGATFVFPAGIGSHVDHLACRDAAFRLLDEGRLSRIILYEDAPYSWLRFIRTEQYRALLRSIELDGRSRAAAFRSDGIGFTPYLRKAAVPFPRGKKLFPLVQASLLSRNLLGGVVRSPKRYRGTIRTVALDGTQLERKQELIFQYRSQLPMLFGTEPERTLREIRASFAKEVTIEVIRKP